MKLWLLKRKPLAPHYDVVNSFVVRAPSAAEARATAALSCGDEGQKAWLSDFASTCEPLTEDGPMGVILIDFNAG